MAIRTRSLAELNSQAFDFLLRNTDGKITLLTPGSVARALLESANRHLEAFYESLSVNHAMAFLSQAQGPYLDLHGALFGLRRRPSIQSRVLSEDRAIRFYVASGTLYDRLPKPGDLNRGWIPAGTTVTNTDQSVIYTVSEDVYFERAATEVYVPAQATVVGTVSNVGAFVLRHHSLGIGDVFVTNPISITSGSNDEGDEAFRSRIASTVLTAQGANEAAVRLAALSAPGVVDVFLVPFHYGSGSFKVVVIPSGNRVPVESLQTAKRNIENTVAYGIFFTVTEPTYRRFSIVTRLTPRPSSTSGEIDVMRLNAERAILSYFGDIRPGGEAVITELGSRIRSSDDRIYDYRIDSLCVDGRHQLMHNVKLGDDELFLPDERISDPVRVV